MKHAHDFGPFGWPPPMEPERVGRYREPRTPARSIAVRRHSASVMCQRADPLHIVRRPIEIRFHRCSRCPKLVAQLVSPRRDSRDSVPLS
jgi:hypothetical protein